MNLQSIVLPLLMLNTLSLVSAEPTKTPLNPNAKEYVPSWLRQEKKPQEPKKLRMRASDFFKNHKK